nr:MAG TPA: hypothetical protein [Caudoviricetes sp.]
MQVSSYIPSFLTKAFNSTKGIKKNNSLPV